MMMIYKVLFTGAILLMVQGCSTMGMVARDDVIRTYKGEGTWGYYSEAAEGKFENKLKQNNSEGDMVIISKASGFELRRIQEVADN
jgi:hypothetical protein|tara:strand:- start:1303 stop:1560 length:258 start_codon:yes stop_codon:yes gene_type:complete